MDLLETDAFSSGFRFIAGIDEAGRGPLAGPVVASAVIFSTPPTTLGIKDSKKLTPKKRETLAIAINRTALAVGIGVVWPAEIDKINILKATLKAMALAVSDLTTEDGTGVKPDLLLIDGRDGINSSIPEKTVIKGDNKSVSIAAASIIAKTTRDRLMVAYHNIFPQYNFKSNKGYGTKDHVEALHAYGRTAIHRKSFSYPS